MNNKVFISCAVTGSGDTLEADDLCNQHVIDMPAVAPDGAIRCHPEADECVVACEGLEVDLGLDIGPGIATHFFFKIRIPT